MKKLLFLAAAVLVVGGIYRTEISRYVARLNVGSSGSSGGSPVVSSFQSTGSSSRALMGGVGNALNR